jgi:hypothetical protein
VLSCSTSVMLCGQLKQWQLGQEPASCRSDASRTDGQGLARSCLASVGASVGGSGGVSLCRPSGPTWRRDRGDTGPPRASSSARNSDV